MKEELIKYLLNDQINDYVFDNSDSYPKTIRIHKEKYDDRFQIIYIKSFNGHLMQEKYEVSGYLDVKEHCIYNPSYTINRILEDNDLIRTDSFNNLSEKITKDIEAYLKEYAFNNEDALKDCAIEKYNHKEHWSIEHYKKEVRELFIEKDDTIIEFQRGYSLTNSYSNSSEYAWSDVYVEYLNNPKETIEKCSNIILEKQENKEGIGLELLLYYDKIDYLNKIKKNEDNAFENVYINKSLYSAIKDIDAKTLNITIHYGNKDLTFKYEYDRFKRDLLNDEIKSGSYGVGYEKVSDFIKENDAENDHGRWTVDFLFSHITSITYGKKELYHKDFVSQEKEMEQDDIEMEM